VPETEFTHHKKKQTCEKINESAIFFEKHALLKDT
jgi:hypothetical protein